MRPGQGDRQRRIEAGRECRTRTGRAAAAAAATAAARSGPSPAPRHPPPSRRRRARRSQSPAATGRGASGRRARARSAAPARPTPGGPSPSRSASRPSRNTAAGGIEAGRNSDQKNTQASAIAGCSSACPGRPSGAAPSSRSSAALAAGTHSRAVASSRRSSVGRGRMPGGCHRRIARRLAARAGLGRLDAAHPVVEDPHHLEPAEMGVGHHLGDVAGAVLHHAHRQAGGEGPGLGAGHDPLALGRPAALRPVHQPRQRRVGADQQRAARLPASMTGMRLLMSVSSSTRALRAPTSVTRPTSPASSSAIWPPARDGRGRDRAARRGRRGRRRRRPRAP